MGTNNNKENPFIFATLRSLSPAIWENNWHLWKHLTVRRVCKLCVPFRQTLNRRCLFLKYGIKMCGGPIFSQGQRSLIGRGFHVYLCFSSRVAGAELQAAAKLQISGGGNTNRMHSLPMLSHLHFTWVLSFLSSTSLQIGILHFLLHLNKWQP